MVTGKENKRELRYKYINRRFHTQCSLFIHFGAASAADAVPSQIPICLNSHSGRRTGHSRNLSFMNQIKSTRRVREKRAQHIITWHPLITFHTSPTLGPFSSKSVPKIHFLFRPKAATGHTQPQKPTDHSARNRARVTNPEQKTTPTDSTTVTGRSFLENARRSRAKLSFFFRLLPTSFTGFPHTTASSDRTERTRIPWHTESKPDRRARYEISRGESTSHYRCTVGTEPREKKKSQHSLTDQQRALG